MKSELYHKLTGQFVPEEVVPTEQDVTLHNLELNWREHPQTIKLYKELTAEANELLDASVTLASSYSQHNNHLQIIDKLTRVDTLRKMMSKYAK